MLALFIIILTLTSGSVGFVVGGTFSICYQKIDQQ